MIYLLNRAIWNLYLVRMNWWHLHVWHFVDHLKNHVCGLWLSDSFQLLRHKHTHTHPHAELISVELPNEYEKETWQLNDTERFKVITENRELGNELYRRRKFDEAEEKYRSALEIIEQLLLK